MFLILMLIAAASAEECLLACQRDYRPLCGSDGVTYANDCQLTSFNCLKKTSVTVAYQGECVQTCNVACTMQNIPVCGTDGQTYGNLCQLESDACLKKTSVTVAHQGECVPTCNVACTMQNIPVCGTDGQTYGNLCQLESDACLKKSGVALKHVGQCAEVVEPVCNVACTMQNNPVCATNGQTYGNLCQLESDACLKKTSIAVRHTGECIDFKSSCNVACTMQWQPVCGTDAVTYGNQCALESQACLQKTGVTIQHAGECVSTECNVACQMIWDPVCGSNAVTYGNMCQLQSDVCLKKSGVVVAHMGEC